ncbi:MAG: DUF3306 domain-containing protein, partial [Mesorhizobium sp.]
MSSPAGRAENRRRVTARLRSRRRISLRLTKLWRQRVLGSSLHEQLRSRRPPSLPEPLPRVEDLTAESDLSAFLRKGVPKMLKRAALRRMWSLDPAIRDHIGPSEYAW